MRGLPQVFAHYNAQKLRRIRLACGISQDNLAERSGRGRQTVISAESGRHVPTLRTLLSLAEVLNVDVAEFFGDDRGAQ